MTKTTINVSMDGEVAQALKHVHPYLQKAVDTKQESLRISTASLFYIFHYAMKCKALEQVNKNAKLYTEWQPIETAPKDGAECWLWDRLFHSKPVWGWYSISTESWMCHLGDSTIKIDKPTHWLPLPAAPKMEEKANDEK